MSRRFDQRIAGILQAIERCQRYMRSLTDGDDTQADMALDAIERNLQIIGEGTVHLPPLADVLRRHLNERQR